MMTRLSNGLTVASDPMPQVESVALGVFVGAGSRCEGEAEHGIAHFLEHMAFKGTARRSARDISFAIEAVGGDINASTGVEVTTYHTHMLAEDLPLALDILADILTEPVFADAEVAREANVILQEMSAAEDIPEERLFDAFPEIAFGGQAIGRRILGTRDSVTQTTSSALRAFMRANYGAQNTAIVAAGNVDHDRLVASAEKAFAGYAAHPLTTPEPARYTGGALADRSASQEAHWLLGFPGRAAIDDTSVAAHLASMVMGGGLSSRLFQSLREERGLVYDVSAFHWSFADCGLFGIHLGTAPDALEEASALVLDELEDALQTLSDDELDRCKALQRAGLLMSRESCVSRMGQAGRQLHVFGRLIDKAERIAEIERVSVAEVREVLAQMLAAPPTVVSVGPHEGIDPAAIASRFGADTLRGAA